jgi:hypothetical protein
VADVEIRGDNAECRAFGRQCGEAAEELSCRRLERLWTCEAL